jgi:hypothetical protein
LAPFSSKALRLQTVNVDIPQGTVVPEIEQNRDVSV